MADQIMKPHGGTRVPLFFVLSGFVMTAAYFPAAGRALSTPTFYVKRLARLYPLLVLTSLSTAFWFYRDAVLPSWHGGRAGPAFFRTVLLGLGVTLFPPAYLFFIAAPIANGYAWFVLVELSVGLLFPSAVRALWKLKPLPTILAALALPFVTELSFRYLMPHLPTVRVPLIGAVFLHASPISWLGILLFGAAVYRVYVLILHSPRWRGVLARLATPLAVLALWLVYFNPPFISFPYAATCIYYPMALALVALSVSEGWMAQLLSTKPFLYLGRRSYSIYMMSAPIGWYLLPHTIGSHGLRWIDERDRWGSLICIGLVCAFGIVAYRFFEVPAKDWMGSRLQRFVSPPKSVRGVV